MGSYTAQWEDEDNNRQVEFSIDYTIENDDVEITNVTPNKVSFVNPEDDSIKRSIGVHTAHGRELLSRQLRRSPSFNAITEEIRESLMSPMA